MPYELTYDAAHHCVYCRMYGDLLVGDLTQFGKDVRDLLDKQDCRRVFNDMREVVHHLSEEDISRIPKRAIELGYPTNTRRAIVFSKDAPDYMLLQDVSEKHGQKVRVFTDVDDAYAWLVQSVQRYYVDNQAKSEGSRIHVLHREGCQAMPAQERRLYVGHFTSIDDAVAGGRKVYDEIEPCEFCCAAT